MPTSERNFNSKTNQMHSTSNLFYFVTTLYMFRTVSPPIVRSLRLYMQHRVYVIQVLWLLGLVLLLKYITMHCPTNVKSDRNFCFQDNSHFETPGSSRLLVSNYKTTWCQNQQVHSLNTYCVFHSFIVNFLFAELCSEAKL